MFHWSAIIENECFKNERSCPMCLFHAVRNIVPDSISNHFANASMRETVSRNVWLDKTRPESYLHARQYRTNSWRNSKLLAGFVRTNAWRPLYSQPAELCSLECSSVLVSSIFKLIHNVSPHLSALCQTVGAYQLYIDRSDAHFDSESHYSKSVGVPLHLDRAFHFVFVCWLTAQNWFGAVIWPRCVKISTAVSLSRLSFWHVLFSLSSSSTPASDRIMSTVSAQYSLKAVAENYAPSKHVRSGLAGAFFGTASTISTCRGSSTMPKAPFLDAPAMETFLSTWSLQWERRLELRTSYMLRLSIT